MPGRRIRKQPAERGRSRLVRFFAVLGLVGLAACGEAAADAQDRAADTGFRGVVLEEPIEKPAFTLTDTEGRPFDFRAATDGYLTLVFFGYTNCPDICPVHMANLSAVLQRYGHDLRSRIRLVFVTTDPERDNPGALRAWLDRFDPDFIGLIGSQDAVARIQTAMDMPTAALPAVLEGDYPVGHSSQILAFSPDDRAHVAYPAGIRQVDWAHDLPRLLDPERFLDAGNTR
jgi:protein SCO1/2